MEAFNPSRNAVMSQNGRRRSAGMRTAFTLIELLVVIGIIALLAAIIFPVFSSVRESNRASTAISNLHDISTKLELYRLDHGSYPPVLFGYQYGTAPMDQAYAAVTDSTNAATKTCGPLGNQECAPYYFPGLYPEYINNVAEFRDPNDDVELTKVVDLNPGSIPHAPTLALCAGTNDDDTACPNANAKGALVIANRVTKSGMTMPMALYQADAFDSSPVVSSLSSLSRNAPFVVRYSPSYTAITADGLPTRNLTPISPETQESLYTRQLRWLQPPGTTYVTCSTWHVPQSNKVLMLALDGSVHKVDTTVFLGPGPDGPLAVAADVNGANTVTTPFWKVKATP